MTHTTATEDDDDDDVAREYLAELRRPSRAAIAAILAEQQGL